ncbi:carboxylate--amine ligase [Luteolibacter algae]|uniref:Carboxylate--amine ligase n=1 Tax=Luteolibacter algae TaxID=454151 RepID=A0ABW5D957_9BACT
MVVTLANPGMPSGGFVEDSKSAILEQLRSSGHVADFKLISSDLSAVEKLQAFDQAHAALGESYPIVLKPDTGERGRGVLIAQSRQEVIAYLLACKLPVIVQKHIPGIEYGVFYERSPLNENGSITGITLKGNTTVTGDGINRLERLILADSRAVCMAPLFLKMHAAHLDKILPEGEIFRLNSLGTHSQGSVFFDHSHLITPELILAIDAATKHFAGFHIGRYDIRVPSEEDLKAGRNWQIVELNGVTSEPTHMYDPRHGLWYAWRCLAAQWTRAFQYGAENRNFGHRPISFARLRERLNSHKARI